MLFKVVLLVQAQNYSNREKDDGLANSTELAPPCTLAINEINSDDPKYFEKSDFLEFVSYCDGIQNPSNLQGFKIIGISTGRAHSNKLTVELVINLSNSRTNAKWFFNSC